MHYLGAPFSTSRLKFKPVLERYIDKEYMDFRKGRNLGWLAPLDRPDPMSEWWVEFPLDLTWIAAPFIFLKQKWSFKAYVMLVHGLIHDGQLRHDT